MRSFLLAILLVSLSSSLPTFLTPSAAQGIGTAPNPWCAHAGQSVWQARRPAQNALAEITIELTCLDEQPVHVRVKAQTRCGRALCTWSFAEQAAVEDDRIGAVFFTFSAQRTMQIQLAADAISVEVENNYNHEGRASDTVRARLTLE